MAEIALAPSSYSAYESLSVGATAVPFTAATTGARRFAFVTCEVASVRFRLDGTAPTAAIGHELLVGDTLTLASEGEVDNAQFISRDGGTATLRCSFGS